MECLKQDSHVLLSLPHIQTCLTLLLTKMTNLLLLSTGTSILSVLLPALRHRISTRQAGTPSSGHLLKLPLTHCHDQHKH